MPTFDYSSVGCYFVTVCTHEREMIFVEEPVARIVADTWAYLPSRFPTVDTDEFVVMPNHMHGIVAIGRAGGPELANIMRAFKSISAIAINRLLERSGRPVWQRNYYEHVVRDDASLHAIREYIRDNPLAWAEDPDNPDATSAKRPVRAQRAAPLR